MNQKEEMKKNLLEDISAYFMQWAYLKDLVNVKKDIRHFQERMQLAPNFTLIIESALVDSYMLSLMRLYDKSDKAKTIPNLIKRCKENINLFPSKTETLLKLEEFENKINCDEQISYTIKELTSRRDSILAHNDKKFFGGKIQKYTAYLPTYCIWRLIDFTEDILKYLFSQFSSEETIKTKYNNDLSNLWELITK